MHQNDQPDQQQHSADQRQQDAQIKPIQRLHIPHQARQHVTGLPEPQPSRRTARQAAEEPNAQIGQRSEGGVVRHQPLGVTQHHPGHARDVQRHRSNQHTKRDCCPDHVPGEAHHRCPGRHRRE